MTEWIQRTTPEALAQYFDHTLLRADAMEADFARVCADSAAYHFKMVAINPAPVALCRQLLKGTDVHVGAAIGFPLGQATAEIKRLETIDALDNGADEIDYVINVTQLKEKRYDFIAKEMQGIVAACHARGKICKVIFETCYLEEAEKIALCHIAREVKPDFIKTSTGFGTGGATVEDIRLMAAETRGEIGVKASGGIRTLEAAFAMIDSGATRIGSTSSVKILDAFVDKRRAL
ncbi:MAG: deoxyribose-phosphate aldolase [Oscillospiraceae bacterium]|nr:deoxyribose-phosphate aldolase [Oscillospiraceae bacterium]